MPQLWPEQSDGARHPLVRSAVEPPLDAPPLGASPLGEPPLGTPPDCERTLSLVITPTPSALAPARDSARTFLRGVDVPEHTVFDVVLSLEEACKNAIRFSGSDREIEVTVAASPGEVRLVIRDHGVGFKPHRVDPSRPPDPLDTQGRGLFLINCLMDHVCVSCDQGAVVTARKSVAR